MRRASEMQWWLLSAAASAAMCGCDPAANPANAGDQDAAQGTPDDASASCTSRLIGSPGTWKTPECDAACDAAKAQGCAAGVAIACHGEVCPKHSKAGATCKAELDAAVCCLLAQGATCEACQASTDAFRACAWSVSQGCTSNADCGSMQACVIATCGEKGVCAPGILCASAPGAPVVWGCDGKTHQECDALFFSGVGSKHSGPCP